MVRPVGVMLWASSHMTREHLTLLSNAFHFASSSIFAFLRSPVHWHCHCALHVQRKCQAWEAGLSLSRRDGRQWQIGLSRHASLAFNRLLYNTQTPHQTARERKRRWRDVDGMERRCHQLETEMMKKKLKCENERDKFESCETFTYAFHLCFFISSASILMYLLYFSLQSKSTCRRSKRIVQILTISQQLRPAATRRRPPDFILHAASSFCLFWAFCRLSLHSSRGYQVRHFLNCTQWDTFYTLNSLPPQFRLLETFSWRDHCNCNSHAHVVSVGIGRHGSLAHRRILREGKSRWRGILPALAKCKLMTCSRVHMLLCARVVCVQRRIEISLFIVSQFTIFFLSFFSFALSRIALYRSWKKTLASRTIGAISLHGPLSHANWLPPFCSRDQRCVSEVNARRRNSSTFSISCPSIHKRPPIHIRPIPSRCTPRELSMAANMDRRRAITTTRHDGIEGNTWGHHRVFNKSNTISSVQFSSRECSRNSFSRVLEESERELKKWNISKCCIHSIINLDFGAFDFFFDLWATSNTQHNFARGKLII